MSFVLTGPTTVTAWVISVAVTLDEPAGATFALESELPTSVTTEPSRTADAPSTPTRPSRTPASDGVPVTS